MGRLGTSVLVAALMATTACSSSDDSSSTLDPSGAPGSSTQERAVPLGEAVQGMQDAGQGLMKFLAPQGKFTVTDTGQPAPCGGINGNEASQVRHTYEAGFRPATSQGLLKKADRQLTRMGLTVTRRETTPLGKGLLFQGEGFDGKLLLHVRGAVLVRAQTDCLDNVGG